jgi:hypothetical protein
MAEHVPTGQWLAIDDRDNLFEANCPHLFLIPDVYDDAGGLDEAQCKRLSTRMTQFLTGQAPQKALSPK